MQEVLVKSHDHSHDLNVKKVDRLGGTRVRLTMEFPGETLRQHEKATANRYLAIAKIPGFRPGKAPLNMVRDKYKEEIKKDVVSHLLEAGLSHALEKTKLTPVNRPNIELGDISFTEDKPFEFHAEFEVEPEIELNQYRGIPLKAAELAATDSEVSTTIDNLRERFATMEPLEVDKASEGNFAVVEIGYELTENPNKKETPKPFTVEVGKEKLLPALDAALLELKVNENRTITEKFPEEYDDKSLAGKEAKFEMKILEVKKKVLPEADDVLANQIKPGSTLDGLKQEIRESILSSKQEEESRDRRQQIVDHLTKAHSFEVPNSMVEQQAHSLLQYMQRDFKEKGFDPSQLKTEDMDAIKKRAEQMVRSSLLLREIAMKENIVLDPSRLQARVDAIATQLNRTTQDAEKFLSGKGMLDRLKDEILTDQVFDFLIQNAQIEKSSNQA